MYGHMLMCILHPGYFSRCIFKDLKNVVIKLLCTSLLLYFYINNFTIVLLKKIQRYLSFLVTNCEDVDANLCDQLGQLQVNGNLITDIGADIAEDAKETLR